LAKSNGYAAYCLAYALVFIVAFSSLSNAGTLDRERIQVLPILFIFLCFEKIPSRYAQTASRQFVRFHRGKSQYLAASQLSEHG
jgi:hypothetical protein